MIIPPFLSDSIFFSITLPDAVTTQTLLDHISTRNSTVKVIVGVSGAISSIVCAKVVALVLSVDTPATRLQTVIDVHVGSEIGMRIKSNSSFLELLLKFSANHISWGGPKLLLDTGIRIRKTKTFPNGPCGSPSSRQ